MKLSARRQSAMVVLAGVLAAGMACSKAPDDGQITSQIQSKLNEDSGLHGKAITVQTSGGVVTLAGAVDNETQRAAASRYAAAVPGIKEVVNNLQTTSGPAPAIAQSDKTPPPVAEKTTAQQLGGKPRPSMPRRTAPADSSQMVAKAPPTDAAPSLAVNENSALSDAAPAAPAPPPPPAPKKVTVPAGTPIAIRLLDSIDSEKAQSGQTFRATLDSPLQTDTYDDVPSGYDVVGHVEEVKSAGKFAGQPLLVLQLDSIAVGGKAYGIQADSYRRQGVNRSTKTAEKVGAGAVLGAIIGGIAGGGKGAGIGAAAGGGVGGGVQAASKGQPIHLDPETVLNFNLRAPLTVTLDKGPNSDRPRLETPGPQ